LKRLVVSLNVAGALAQVDNKQYEAAAKALSDVLTSNGAEFFSREEEEEDAATGEGWSLASWRDVASYVCFLATASLGRAALRSAVVDHARFKHRARSLHARAVDLPLDAHRGRYASAMETLDALTEELKLDPFFAKHATALRDLCVEKCVAQHCMPYSRLSLSGAAQTFNMAVDVFEYLVAKLIVAGKLQAKIDKTNDAVVHHVPDERQIALKKVLKQGNAYRQEIQSLILRMSCLENDFIVRNDNEPVSGGSSSKYHHHHRGSSSSSRFGGGGGGGASSFYGGGGDKSRGFGGSSYADRIVVDDDDDDVAPAPPRADDPDSARFDDVVVPMDRDDFDLVDHMDLDTSRR